MFQISAVLQLLLGGQGKEFFANGELAVDFLLVETKVCDVEEAHVVNGIAELVGQLLFPAWSVKLRQIKGDKVGLRAEVNYWLVTTLLSDFVPRGLLNAVS